MGLSGGKRIKSREKGGDVRHFKQRLETITETAHGEGFATILARGEDTDDATQPGRIHVRNVRQLNDYRLIHHLARNRLEVEQRANC